MSKKLRVTLVKSLIGVRSIHKATIKCLGLKRINSVSELPDNQSVRGMVTKVSYLVRCENIER